MHCRSVAVPSDSTVADECQLFRRTGLISPKLTLRIPVYTLVLVLALPTGLVAAEPAIDTSRLLIPGGTAVQLQLTQTVSSQHAHAGDPLDFFVEKDFSVGDYTVLRKGSHVRGTVIGIKGRRLLGVGAKISI